MSAPSFSQNLRKLFDLSIDRLDIISWFLVLQFFGAASLYFGGDLQASLTGALLIILLMLFVSHSIALILGVLQNHPKMGELTGYITNGPEALVMIVGLLHNKLIMAMGVPLGSNFANPILFLIALLMSGQLIGFFRLGALRSLLIILATAGLAASFFQLESGNIEHLGLWALITLVVTVIFYRFKGDEDCEEESEGALPVYFLLPAVLFLIGSGYFLDPAVSYTAQASKLDEGIISFCVLSFITSWPEFRTAISLIKLHRLKAAVMNILISNITNLWLAVGGVIAYLFLQR